jgi:hypothetical protein
MGEIRVTCKTADRLPFDQIELLQGELKQRTDEQIDKICRSIIKHGWAFPEFIWKNEDRKYRSGKTSAGWGILINRRAACISDSLYPI